MITRLYMYKGGGQKVLRKHFGLEWCGSRFYSGFVDNWLSSYIRTLFGKSPHLFTALE